MQSQPVVCRMCKNSVDFLSCCYVNHKYNNSYFCLDCANNILDISFFKLFDKNNTPECFVCGELLPRLYTKPFRDIALTITINILDEKVYSSKSYFHHTCAGNSFLNLIGIFS